MPKEKVGLVVLANLEESGMVRALAYQLIDEVLELERGDWHAFFLQKRTAELKARQAKKQALLRSRVAGTRPSRELSAYAYRMVGGYQDAEDALQETLLKAWRHLGSYEPTASLRPLTGLPCFGAGSVSSGGGTFRAIDIEAGDPAAIGRRDL